MIDTIQVRVPAEKLEELLPLINNNKPFLDSRYPYGRYHLGHKICRAGEQTKQKISKNISQLKANKDKVKLENENMEEDLCMDFILFRKSL